MIEIKYSKYQKSITPWIKQFPDHWEEKRLKFAVSLINEKVEAKSVDLDFIGLEQIESWTGRRIEDENSCSEGIVTRFSKGDVLFGKLRPYLAKTYLADSEGVATTEALVLRSSEDVVAEYLKYYLLSPVFIKIVDSSTYGSKMPRANWEFIGNLAFLVPPRNEQYQIGRFLRHKTTSIDNLIAKKKEINEKLDEQRIAIITHAVTKGINSDVPTKNSEIKWLGEIPTHWNIRRLRFAIQSNPVKSEITSQVSLDTLVSFVPMDAVGEYGGIRLDVEKELSDVYAGYTYFKDGDVVVAKITPCFENGKGALAHGLTNKIGFGTTELHIMRPLDDYSSRWLFYLTCSHAFRSIGESEMYGAGGQKRVPESFIKDFRLGIPPYEEQESIADFIDEKTIRIDKMKAANFDAIEKLTEYRSALITAAVTGQIDVRNIDIPKDFK